MLVPRNERVERRGRGGVPSCRERDIPRTGNDDIRRRQGRDRLRRAVAHGDVCGHRLPGEDLTVAPFPVRRRRGRNLVGRQLERIVFPERHGRLLAVVHVGDDHLLHRLEERIASGEFVLHGDVDRAVLDERGELVRDVDDGRAFRRSPFGVNQSVPGADQLRALRQTVFRTLGDDVALGLSVERVARFEPLDLPEDGIASHRRVVHVNRDAGLDELGDIRAIRPPRVEHAVLGLLDDERMRLFLEGRVGARGDRGLHAGDVRCGGSLAAEHDERGAADRIVERDDRASVLLAPGGGVADAAGLGVPHLGDASRLAERRLELRRRGVVERDKVPVGGRDGLRPVRGRDGARPSRSVYP